MQFIVPVIAIVLGTCVLALLSWRFLSVRTSVIARLFGDRTQGSLAAMAENDPTQQGWIAGWLFRAGFRGKRAEVLFWVSTLACGLFAGTVFFLLWQQGYFLAASQFISGIPGGVGNVFVPFVLATPWLISIVFAICILRKSGVLTGNDRSVVFGMCPRQHTRTDGVLVGDFVPKDRHTNKNNQSNRGDDNDILDQALATTILLN